MQPQVPDRSPISFPPEDLEPVKVPVTMGKDRYVLLEADEGVYVKHREFLMRCARMEGGEVVGMEGVNEADSYLLSLCLYRADADGELVTDKMGRPDRRHLVTQDTVKTWKPRVVRQLAQRAKDISDLKDESETEEVLEKRIADDTRKLELLRSSGAETVQEGVAKNGQPSTEGTTEPATA